MQVKKEEIRVRGKDIFVSSLHAANKLILITGKLIKTAAIKDELYVEEVEDPEFLIEEFKKAKGKADIFTFAQQPPEIKPKYNYYMEWENLAAISITSFDYWFKHQIHQNVRNKIRKAEKKGVEVRLVDFDDEFVKGIVDIYNETPIRQDKPFWHYGKDFDTIKKISATYLERSDFIGAYYNDKLIGFTKITYTERYAKTMHVISKIEHRDKAPTNALIAKAVEITEKEKKTYLIYGEFDWGKIGNSALTGFKNYNGFEKIEFPRYYIPLTFKGKIILKLKLHHGIVKMLLGILPKKLTGILMDLRKKWYIRRYSHV